ncbi:c-type cytochrome [Teichococcus oryzae]|uniref:Cytochrome c protein n=1 Tax=Teichococcus oryzae TaxID=1608942 RepID=A0A5B2TG76_9PROT|nr:cytochrome c [Pseudoroseomonas oryzae]KAA2213506.1 cytochrome c protein [Pseudoroseomonas oryzae]
MRFAGMLAAGAITLALGMATQQPAHAEDKPYQVQDGKVDRGTYNGYRRYGNACERCHGQDGAGSSFAPNLTESLKRLSHEQFMEVVINGRQNVTSSQQSVMPPFGQVEDVVLYIEDIYAYLKARSDGAIGPGRPQRMAN